TNASLTITPAALSVTANNVSRGYGLTNPILTGIITGIQNGDNITATSSTAAPTNSHVSSYLITATLVDPGGKLSNYTVHSTNGQLSVTGPLLTVTIDNQS